MGCPGGCVNGGGQPVQPARIRNWVDLKSLRAAAPLVCCMGRTLSSEAVQLPVGGVKHLVGDMAPRRLEEFLVDLLEHRVLPLMDWSWRGS